jgi:predicted nucleic acid-binding protein
VRVALDSSVLIAAHLTRAGTCAELYEEILQRHDLVLSRQILDEVARGLRMRFLIRDDLVERALAAMTRAAELVEPSPVPVEARRSPDGSADRRTAAAARADVLVTVAGVPPDPAFREAAAIVRPVDFWKLARA